MILDVRGRRTEARVRRARAGFALLVLALVAVAGCGGQDAVGNRIPGRTLTIYSSVPLHGASSVSGEAVVGGELLALAQVHDRVGRYHIVFRTLDDSTTPSGGWDPVQTTLNASQAAQNRTTIGYVGDLDSGASAISIPVLNRADIPQISPTSTAVGLTSSAAGASPGEPQKYYPTGVRTFARVVPTDAVESNVQVRLQQSLGCRKTFVVDDGAVDGQDGALSFALAAQSAGLRLLGIQSFQRGATSYAPLAASVAGSGADCVLISAIDESDAARVTEQIASALPDARIFATAGVADSAYIDPARGGIPASLDQRLLVTAATPDPTSDPAAMREFLASYGRRFGPGQPSAIFGYEAMSLMLSAIARATDHGTRTARRSSVRAAIFSTRDRHSVLGTYSIDRNGDTTIRRYGVYRVVDGQLVFWKTIDG